MKQMNEELLAAWLNMSSSIRNDRVVINMSYNETHICNLLYKAKSDGSEPPTATDLCKKTGLLKSQMNKVLTGLEDKGIVVRRRCPEDRRRIWIELSEEGTHVYEQEHQRILDFVDSLIQMLGTEDTKETIRLLNVITENAAKILSEAYKR